MAPYHTLVLLTFKIICCQAYAVTRTNKGEEARQSHDGYQLLVGKRIYLFYGWNRGSQPPLGERLPRTDMQLDEGFWMRWSDDFGKSFLGGRVVIPVRRTAIDESNPWDAIQCCREIQSNSHVALTSYFG